jgi:hypothetical protein
MGRRHTSRRNGNNLNNNYNKLNQNIKDLIDVISKLQGSFDKPNDDKDDKKDPFSKAKKRINGASDRMTGYGEYLQSFGSKMKTANGQLSIFGKIINGSGSILSSFGKGLTKANGYLLAFSIAIDIASKAAKSIADADKRQQDIQNRRNTLFTQRNIELSNIESEGYVDQLNTAYIKQMSLFNEHMVKLSGEQTIANKEAIANAALQIGSTIGDINQAAWERLSVETDILAEKTKLGIADNTKLGGMEYSDIEKTRQKEQKVRDIATWGFSGRSEERAYQQRKELLNAEAENAKLNAETVRNRAENAWSESINSLSGGGTEADSVRNKGYERWNDKYGNKGVYKDNSRFETKDLSTKLASSTAAGMTNSVTTKLVGIDFGGITDAALTKSETTLGRDITNATNDLNSQSAFQQNYFKVGTEYYEKAKEGQDIIIDKASEIQKSVIDTNSQIEKMFQKMAQTVEEWAMKFQDVSFKNGIGMGITNRGQLETYSSYMNGMVTELSRKFGMTAEQVLQLQQDYSANGRNKIMNDNDLIKQGAFSQIYLGGDINTASELINNTELFNMGVSKTVDLMSEMAKKVNKLGLDGRKYMKDLSNYLKQANKYTFKDGVKGISEMAKWAQNVRFNMNNMPQILENIQSGGLENIITKSARMQVLGGQYARYADPLAMYYEAYNDPDALAKRFNNMTKGMGRFDAKNGNVTFGQAEQEIMRAFADASGQSIEDVRAQATYNVKKNKVTGISNNLTNEQQQSLVNKAFYENDQWKVNTIDGKTINVSDVNKDNVNMVQGDTYEDTMEKGMQQLVSFTQQFMGAKEGNLSQLSKTITDNGTLANNLNERLIIEEENFNKKFDEYIQNITKNIGEATKTYAGSLESTLKEHTKEWDKVKEAIYNQTKSLMSALNDIYKSTSNSGFYNGVAGNTKNGGTFINSTNMPSYETFIQGEAQVSRMNETPSTTTVNDGIISSNSPISNTGKDNVITINDGFINPKNKSMVVQANSVKPINDGIAKTHPQDSAIFAKANGPFDTLFNGVFNKIDDVWKTVSSISLTNKNSNVVPIEPIGISKDISTTTVNDGIISSNSPISNTGKDNVITINPVDIKIEGSIRLNSNGHSVDLFSLINDNPLFIRQISQMISDEIGKSINGGRSIPEYGYLQK